MFEPGSRVPRRFTVVIDEPDVPYVVELDVEWTVDVSPGGMAAVQRNPFRGARFVVRPDGDALSADGLRRVPLGELQSRVFSALVGDRGSDLPSMPTKLPRDELLVLVAREYGFWLSLGQSPTRMIAETFDVSRATAGRWVAEAREAGVLTVDPPRRPSSKGRP